jgi:LPS-assembly lipoprotein
MKRSLTGLLLVMLTTLLAACGFQLRGVGGSDFALKELDLSARDAYGDMVKDVRRMLETRGVRVHAGAPYQLVLAKETNTQRAASYTGVARGAEYQLTGTLEYEIRDNQNLLLNGDRLEVQKYYVVDSNNLAGSNQEADRLRVEMRRDLVQQLGLRLQQLNTNRLAEMQEKARIEAEAKAKAEAAAAAPKASPVPVIPLFQR